MRSRRELEAPDGARALLDRARDSVFARRAEAGQRADALVTRGAQGLRQRQHVQLVVQRAYAQDPRVRRRRPHGAARTGCGFTCVGRPLPPEQQAALVLREVMGFASDEAARALGLTESVLRHHRTSARGEMQRRFEGLCSLVDKEGVCYQCRGPREATPAPRQGAPNLLVRDFDQRCAIVRRPTSTRAPARRCTAPSGGGPSNSRTAVVGSTVMESDCGRD